MAASHSFHVWGGNGGGGNSNFGGVLLGAIVIFFVLALLYTIVQEVEHPMVFQKKFKEQPSSQEITALKKECSNYDTQYFSTSLEVEKYDLKNFKGWVVTCRKK